MNAATLRLLLAAVLFAMYILAMPYLRRCLPTLGQLTAWGLLALLIPARGSFLVIVSRPAGPRRRYFPHRINRR